MMKKLIILFCFYSVSLSSKEMVSDLITNSQLHHVKVKKHNNKSVLSLPFIDDFSSNNRYPDSNLWVDNYVFINRDYGINPITIGVATFDGLNENGRAYNMTLIATDSENADTLTSQKIDLSNTDSVYFMFYYQPQGNGNDPQLTDSLILEFALPIACFIVGKESFAHVSSINLAASEIVIFFSLATSLTL